MAYDPNVPATNAEATSAMFRGQFQGLKALIDLLQSIAAAQVDAVNTLPPGDPANVTVSVVGSTLHLTFDIPQGAAGADGNPGADGPEGPQGAEGQQGAPGEVTLAQLDAAIATTSANSNGVATLGLSVSDPPTQSELQAVTDKLDELILALRQA